MILKSSEQYPRAIIHIDGDCFFAACEVMQNPKLKGKPVVTGAERGIVSSLTYEAKARGIKRSMNLYEARRVCPEVITLPSDYETYSLMSERMFKVVRRFTSQVEEYSIDECFADITGSEKSLGLSYEKIAAEIKKCLDTELGITFSVGLAPTKVLTKVGSKWQKPSGLTCIPTHRIAEFLGVTPAEKIWGIGPSTSAYLKKYDVLTADDLARKPEAWVKHHLNKPHQEIWQELCGRSVYPVIDGGKHAYQSISKTKTFTPPTSEAKYLMSQLSKNIENACIKMRRYRLAGAKVFFYLKTQDYNILGLEIKLSRPTNLPTDIVEAVTERFAEVFNPYLTYRATGIVVMDLAENDNSQLDLFGQALKAERMSSLFGSIDLLSQKYGKHVAFLGSSFRAMTGQQFAGDRSLKPLRKTLLFSGENARKRLGVPFMGEVI